MRRLQIVGPIFVGGLAIALAGAGAPSLADDISQTGQQQPAAMQQGDTGTQQHEQAGMEQGSQKGMEQRGQAGIHQPGQTGTGQAATATAGEIAKNPSQFYGKKVTVKAEVEDVYNAHAFTLDEDELFAGPDLLVLNPNPATQSEGDMDVTVTGTIQQFVRADLERNYEWFDSAWLRSGNEEIDFSTRPVLIADSIRTEDGQELVRAGGTMGSRAGDQPAGSEQPGLGTQDEPMKDRSTGDDPGMGDPGTHDTDIDTMR